MAEITPARVAEIREWLANSDGERDVELLWAIPDLCDALETARSTNLDLIQQLDALRERCAALEAEQAIYRAETADPIVNQALDMADLSARRFPTGILASEVRRLQAQVSDLEEQVATLRSKLD